MPLTEGLATLYDLDLGPAGGPVLHFCSLADFDTVISRGGVTYTPIPMEASGFEWRSNGALPQPTLAVSNVYGGVNVLFNDYGELMGCPVTRIRILAQWLDGFAQPDPLAEIGRDTFVIAQKTSHTPLAAVFRLAWRIDQEGTTLPRRLVLADVCTHIYRRWTGAGFVYDRATCPYTGGAMFDVFNNPTSDGSQDQCSRYLSGCRKRFPGQPLPSRAFPAVGRIR